jgi:hypothetical protein
MLADWAGVLERRLHLSVAAEPVSVLVHAGCSPACGLQGMLRMRLASSVSPRWVLRSSPVPVDGGIPTERFDVLLRTAATVYLTTFRLAVPSVPAAFAAPTIRRVYFPPLGLWRSFLGGVPGQGDLADPLSATEVFSVLVEDGMPVRDALGTAAQLAR